MEIGAAGVLCARRGRAIQASSVQSKGAAEATREAVAGGISVCRATGSAFGGSTDQSGPQSSYL